jgi:hypothetical protein
MSSRESSCSRGKRDNLGLVFSWVSGARPPPFFASSTLRGVSGQEPRPPVRSPVGRRPRLRPAASSGKQREGAGQSAWGGQAKPSKSRSGLLPVPRSAAGRRLAIRRRVSRRCLPLCGNSALRNRETAVPPGDRVRCRQFNAGLRLRLQGSGDTARRSVRRIAVSRSGGRYGAMFSGCQKRACRSPRPGKAESPGN